MAKVRELRGRDPRRPFFAALTAAWADDSIDDTEGHEGFFDTEEAAAEVLTELAEEHGTDGWIFYCVPVARIRRGKIIHTKMNRANLPARAKRK